MVVLGIDPGFASTGWAVLAPTPGDTLPRVVAGGVIRTKRRAGKGVRVSEDDHRRALEITRAIQGAILEHRPDRVAYEAYQQIGGGGWTSGAHGWKAALTVGIVVAVSEGIESVCLLPADLKVAATGNRKGSKEDVQEGLASKLSWDPEVLEGVPPSMRAHLVDAAGLALAALRGE